MEMTQWHKGTTMGAGEYRVQMVEGWKRQNVRDLRQWEGTDEHAKPHKLIHICRQHKIYLYSIAHIQQRNVRTTHALAYTH